MNQKLTLSWRNGLRQWETEESFDRLLALLREAKFRDRLYRPLTQYIKTTLYFNAEQVKELLTT